MSVFFLKAFVALKTTTPTIHHHVQCVVYRLNNQPGRISRWMNPDACFSAWDAAIQDAGMVWKYRQVQDGEWNVLEALGDARYRKQGSGGKGRVDRGEHADARLDMPLPWDHVDTGIAKWWLKADLQRALEVGSDDTRVHHHAQPVRSCLSCFQLVCWSTFWSTDCHP